MKHRGLAVAARVATVATGALAIVWLGMGAGWFRGPYPEPSRDLAWALGVPAGAYNFGVVAEGRIYRSARPDARFLEWVAAEHGVRRVISLSGDDPSHPAARAMGMDVAVFGWSASELPPEAELRRVAAMLAGGEPVLLHCASGSDRTGYAIAAHRVWNEDWDRERAVEEMTRYWHRPERAPALHEELAERLGR